MKGQKSFTSSVRPELVTHTTAAPLHSAAPFNFKLVVEISTWKQTAKAAALFNLVQNSISAPFLLSKPFKHNEIFGDETQTDDTWINRI